MAREKDTEFSPKTLDILAKRVGVRCSNPACRRLTTGPRSDSARIVCTGVGAHITAASPGGPRYDKTLTNEQRASAENGIWLCQNHAKLVDNDEVRYTVALLQDWKRRVENAALAELEGGSAHHPEDAAEVELSVGGVEIGSRKPVRPEKRGYDAKGDCDRHDYVLSVVVRNLGNERLASYHVDVEFPAQPLDHPEAHPAYVSGRSARGRGFFRISGERAPELFPGDEPEVLALPYHVDDAIYHGDHSTAKSAVYAELVRVTLYRPGLPPLSVERPFEDFSNF
jgi:hypothetical protein